MLLKELLPCVIQVLLSQCLYLEIMCSNYFLLIYAKRREKEGSINPPFPSSLLLMMSTELQKLDIDLFGTTYHIFFLGFMKHLRFSSEKCETQIFHIFFRWMDEWIGRWVGMNG